MEVNPQVIQVTSDLNIPENTLWAIHWQSPFSAKTKEEFESLIELLAWIENSPISQKFKICVFSYNFSLEFHLFICKNQSTESQKVKMILMKNIPESENSSLCYITMSMMPQVCQILISIGRHKGEKPIHYLYIWHPY